MSSRILIIEDDADVLELLMRQMRKHPEFQAITMTDGAAGLREARERRPDLIVLDLMLPKMDGLEVCRSLKRDPATGDIAIIMLTARVEEVDRIAGLEFGADDYVTKPFSPREIVLRMKAILRRKTGATSSDGTLVAGKIVIEKSRHHVAVAGRAVELTALEFKLLTALIERRGRVQSRDRLLHDVWGYESLIDTRTVDTHVQRLREKLGKSGDNIETVRGFGYRFAAS